jgi:hypothetical protein
MAAYENVDFTNRIGMVFLPEDTYSQCTFARMVGMSGHLYANGPCTFTGCTGELSMLYLESGCRLDQCVFRVTEPERAYIGGISWSSSAVYVRGGLRIVPGWFADRTSKSGLIRNAVTGGVYRYMESVADYSGFITCVFSGQFESTMLSLTNKDGVYGCFVLGVPPEGANRLVVSGLPGYGPVSEVTLQSPYTDLLRVTGSSGILTLDFNVSVPNTVYTVKVRSGAMVPALSFSPG